jgi:hypothetical protein
MTPSLDHMVMKGKQQLDKFIASWSMLQRKHQQDSRMTLSRPEKLTTQAS